MSILYPAAKKVFTDDLETGAFRHNQDRTHLSRLP